MPTPEEIYYKSLDEKISVKNYSVTYPVTPTFAYKKETWDDIWLRFMESEEYTNCPNEELFMAYTKWLEANYKAPVSK